jgi:hypothetical protein
VAAVKQEVNMHVNQLAHSLQVSTDTVRFYTKIAFLRPLKSAVNGYKIYDESDRQRLQAHRATALAFERIDPSPCAEMVLFPDMEISEQLAGLLLWVDLAGV